MLHFRSFRRTCRAFGDEGQPLDGDQSCGAQVFDRHHPPRPKSEFPETIDNHWRHRRGQLPRLPASARPQLHHLAHVCRKRVSAGAAVAASTDRVPATFGHRALQLLVPPCVLRSRRRGPGLLRHDGEPAQGHSVAEHRIGSHHFRD